MIPGLSLQPRDLEILVTLFESRIATILHLAAFHFDGKIDAARKRLQALKKAGFVATRRRKAYEPALLSISKRGLQLLTAEGALQSYPAFSWPAIERRNAVSALTLAHELMTLDTKAAFVNAIRHSAKFSVASFTTWPLLSQFVCHEPLPYGGTKETLIKPDGFFWLIEQEKGGPYDHSFFLEVDRSTETLETISRKCACYCDYYRSGGFAVKQGAARSDFNRHPFRVLLVCKSKERCNNIAATLVNMHPPILRQVWLATFDDVKRDPLGQIWLEPATLREAGPKTSPRRDQFSVLIPPIPNLKQAA